MELYGYTFCFDRKYPALISLGKEGPIRFKMLGRNYTPESIKRCILFPKFLWQARRLKMQRFCIHTKSSHGIYGLRTLYYTLPFWSRLIPIFSGCSFLEHTPLGPGKSSRRIPRPQPECRSSPPLTGRSRQRTVPILGGGYEYYIKIRHNDCLKATIKSGRQLNAADHKNILYIDGDQFILLCS